MHCGLNDNQYNAFWVWTVWPFGSPFLIDELGLS